MRKHTSASLPVRDERAVCVFEAPLRDSPAACEKLKQQSEQWRGGARPAWLQQRLLLVPLVHVSEDRTITKLVCKFLMKKGRLER